MEGPQRPGQVGGVLEHARCHYHVPRPLRVHVGVQIEGQRVRRALVQVRRSVGIRRDMLAQPLCPRAQVEHTACGQHLSDHRAPLGPPVGYVLPTVHL